MIIRSLGLAGLSVERKKSRMMALLGLGILQLSLPGISQDFTPAEREFQNQQRQQTQELQDKEVQRQLQEHEKELNKPAPLLPSKDGDIAQGKSIYVEKITLDVGDAKVAQPERIFKRYRGRELSSTDLLNLLREVNDFYASLGYVTSVAC